MRTPVAAAGSAAFFVAAPGTVVGLVPWLITGWHVRGPLAVQVLGVLLIVVGLVPVVHAFAQFARAGGTPMPLAPTERLVVSGFNRYVRNPMYFGLLVVLLGQALVFGSLGVVLYAAVMWLVTASFVRWYEEPALLRRFGAQYAAYRAAVPAWWPRGRPWTPVREQPRF